MTRPLSMSGRIRLAVMLSWALLRQAVMAVTQAVRGNPCVGDVVVISLNVTVALGVERPM